MWTKLIEVPVAILLHFVWRVDGQGPVWVDGDHHTANVRLEREEAKGRCKQLVLLVSFTQTPLPFLCPFIRVEVAGILAIHNALLRHAMPEVKLTTRQNKEKFMESTGWAVNTDRGVRLHMCMKNAADV